MKKKYFLRLSYTIKFTILMSILLIVGVQYIISSLWLSPIASDREIKMDLERMELERSELSTVNAYNDVNGKTGLMIAAWRGLLHRIELLLAHKANPNLISRNKHHNTALHLACVRGDSVDSEKIIKLLLENNADVNAIDEYGNTPLHNIVNIANFNIRFNILTLLINHNANINAQNKEGNTLIHLLVDKNDLIFLQKIYALFKDKINFLIKNKKDQTPLKMAQKKESEESLTQFLERAEQNL